MVKSEAFKAEAFKQMRITQGYLSLVPERTVRVRVKGDKGFITVKGKSSASGVSRFEWEKEIPVEEARDLLQLCEPGIIDKTRFLVKCGDYCFEIDEFYGDNKGLTMAEIELPDEHAAFERPDWLGEEVTGDSRFYNAMLTKKPFTKW